MLQLLDYTQNNIIATRADGLLTAAGYAKILPLVHNIIRAGKQARWYFEIDDHAVSDEKIFLNRGLSEECHHETPLPNVEAFEKIALIAPQKWKVFLLVTMKRFAGAAIMCFSLQERGKALAWLNEDNYASTDRSISHTEND